MSRRVLIIALHFPPAHTTSTRRILKFARYLPEHGWESSVVTVRTGFHRHLDETALAEVPAGTRVYRTFGFDPRHSLSIAGRYPGLLALPDRAAPWFPFATWRALAIARRERFDAILSTSPPVTAHCVALLLHDRTGLPWVADLRDPWAIGDRGPLHGAIDRTLEPRVLRAATRIVVTTRPHADDLARRFGDEVGDKVNVISNGYDEADFESLPAPRANGRFRLAHVGQLNADHRGPASFLQALRHCLDRGLLPADSEVAFIGAGPMAEGGELQRMADGLGLGAVVSIERHVPYRQALERMMSAAALLLLQPGDALHMQIPSKAFEYLRSGRRILALAPARSATAALMGRHAGVEVAAPADVDEIAAKLVGTHRAWQKESQFVERDLSGCDRRALAAELAKILVDSCDPGRAR